MTVFHLSPEVGEAFPGTLIALVTAEGVRGERPWPEPAAALDAMEAEVAAGSWLPADEHDPRLASWHAAYRAFGTNPRRERPSVDALGRRLARKGALPRINPAVDTYNTVSVRHGLPAGAFDLDAVAGDVTIRFATGAGAATEEFTPLGEPGTVEHPRPGEVVYADATSVLTRHWNHRDAHRTRVTPASARVAFLMETVDAARDGDLLREAAGQLRDWIAPHADDVHVRYLSPALPHTTA
ncbi:B3/4 domain-containing protein [Streptomyces sp. NPDC090022]|uniref:B3/B4 domain-containing protein n=1 Tax=Streptomyces sp. NPDC090022 TaxID=3365920 RepID=UPI0038004AA4